MDKENENNASVEGITTAVFCREGDLKQFTDVFARLGRSCTAAQNLWTTHPLSSGLPLFLIPELRAVSGNLRQPEVKCFAYK